MPCGISTILKYSIRNFCMTNNDEKYMKMCLKLAKRGAHKVLPNPMVGCVVLDKHGQIVSTGYHKKYGANHAERDALLKLHGNEAKGGTLYVNLEPCSHYGKTPPCTDLIIERKIKRVVIGAKDVNPKVDGISQLKNAGIEVVTGVLEKEASALNKVFIKNITKQMPYVVLKIATTIDGKIATRTGNSKWITSDKSRDAVYKLRKNFDCIMTTSNTVIADNPKMIHRHKCILDKDLRTPSDAQIYSQGEIYIASKDNTPIKNDNLDVEAVLKKLFQQGIYTVFVECGGTLGGNLIKENLVDEIYQFIAPKIINDNSAMSCFNGDNILLIGDAKQFKVNKVQRIGDDILIIYSKQLS